MSDVKKIGVVSATGIVAGNMMGSGVALLPASLASVGSIIIFAWVIAIIGAMSLAWVFARLGTDNPQSGGPVAYAGEVSPILGYQSGVLYYHSNWIGNLSIAVAGVSYLAVFIPELHSGFGAGIATIIAVWVFAFINLVGADWVSRLVTIGVVLLLIPVVLTGTVGWTLFDGQTFSDNWNTSGKSDGQAIIGGVLLVVWSFIGVESASVNANLVDRPRRTIPLSTLLGTGLAAVVYVLSTMAIMGMFPAAEVAASGAPFADSSAKILGSWSAPIVSAVTAFACFASLGSWMMLTAEAGARTARDGYFPKIYGERNSKGTASKGIIIEAAQMTALMIILMILQGDGESTGLFNTLITIAVLTVLLPYFYSCLNLRAHIGLAWRNAGSLLICALASLFCLIALYGAKGEGLAEAIIVTIVIYFFYVRWESAHHQDKTLHFPENASTSVPDQDTNEVLEH
ncbi:MAG: cadaverine/lysine antiporter [Pseudomonadales bacterium]|nr:cadaverine/lysine antiporter [Pseudomonadales bacterium]